MDGVLFGLKLIDLAMVVLYFVAVIVLGLWMSRRVKTEEDYFMGGRKFGKALLVFHWLCTGTHSEMPVSVSGLSYKVGLGGIWLQWMWLFCTPFYWLIAPIMRRLRYITTGDFFRERYGRGLEMIYSLIALVFYIFFIGMTMQGAGRAITGATGGAMQLGHAILILSVISSIYVFFGGLVAAAFTDFVQGVLIVVLSILLIPFGLTYTGGIGSLHAKLPADMFSIVAPEGMKEGNLFYVVMMSIVSLVGIVVQPHTMTATGSGKTELEARIGMCYGNFIKRFLTIAWTFTGLIGLAIFGTGIEHREEVWGRSVQLLLPDGVRGLMIAAMLAGVTAVETFMIVGSAIFTRNFYRYVVTDAPERHYLYVGRVAAMGMLVTGIVMAFVFTSVAQAVTISLDLIAFLGMAFWLGVTWRRANVYGAWASFSGAFAVWAFVTFGLGWSGPEDAPRRVLCFLPVEVILMVVGSLLTPRLPKEQLNRFYARLHTSVADEQGDDITALHVPPKKLINHPDWEIPRLDILDVGGFLLACAVVVFLIGLLYGLARVGA